MGIQENVMAYWNIVPRSLKFVMLLAVGTSFFSEMATLGIMGKQEVRTDVLASSMSFIHMHTGSEVRVTWDRLPFTMAVTTGSLTTFFQTHDATISPYPLTIPMEGSEEIDEVHYFLGDGIEEFNFTNRGTPGVKAS